MADHADVGGEDTEMEDEQQVSADCNSSKREAEKQGSRGHELSPTMKRSSHCNMPSQEVRHRSFVGNPQISITDTQGHVTDVDTTSDDGGRDSVSPTSPATHHGDVPLNRHSGLPCTVASMAAAPGGISSYPYCFLQGFGLINTNLASIPPYISNTDTFLQSACFKAPQSISSGSIVRPQSVTKSHSHATSPTHQSATHRAQQGRSRRFNAFQETRDVFPSYYAALASATPIMDVASLSCPGSGNGSSAGIVTTMSLETAALAQAQHCVFAFPSLPPTTLSSSCPNTSPNSYGSPLPGTFPSPLSPSDHPIPSPPVPDNSPSSSMSPLNGCYAASFLRQPIIATSPSDSQLFNSRALSHQDSGDPMARGLNCSDSHLFEKASSTDGAVDFTGDSHSFQMSSAGVGEGSMSRLFELEPAGTRTVDDVLRAIKDALDTRCPEVAYECLEKRFRLQQADLEMEVEVFDGEGKMPQGLHVRKLSGDYTHYAALCHHLLSCVNSCATA